MNDLFERARLIQVVSNLKTSQKFLLDKFFPNVVASDTPEVAIDIDVGVRRMAPFVSPLVEGKMVESRRYQTNLYKPAYIKDKRAPDLRKPVRRMIGEAIGAGTLTGAERMMQNIVFEMADQIDVIDRRLEWMAASALLGGTVTIEGDGFPTELVDFGRDASLTVGLTSTATWTYANIVTNATASPSNDIENWQQLILQKSGGVATDIVFSTAAWQAFKLDPALKGAIIFPTLAEFGNQINPGAQVTRGAVYKGRWGNFDLWVYNDWYVDPNGVEQPMIPAGSLVMSGRDLQGTRAFGMIYDDTFAYEALPYAPKSWVENDPAQRIMLMQSSPIVIPSRVNASFAAAVL